MVVTPASSLHRLIVKRVYPAPRAKVFRPWTDPKELTRWWGPPGYESPSAEVDLRVGGGYRFAMRKPPDGNPHFVFGTYEEVVIPEKLVFTWNWEDGPPFGSNTLVTIEFREVPGGTELIMTHERFDSEFARNEHSKGWNGCFEKLADYIGH